MSMIGAFSRTRQVLGGKREIPLAMTKWWKKKRPAEAEITMHLSMNEVQTLVPWFKTFPKKMVDRVPIYLWPVGTFSFIYAVAAWSEARDHAEDYEHRF